MSRGWRLSIAMQGFYLILRGCGGEAAGYNAIHFGDGLR
jgi:hypothetical protein